MSGLGMIVFTDEWHCSAAIVLPPDRVLATVQL